MPSLDCLLHLSRAPPAALDGWPHIFKLTRLNTLPASLSFTHEYSDFLLLTFIPLYSTSYLHLSRVSSTYSHLRSVICHTSSLSLSPHGAAPPSHTSLICKLINSNISSNVNTRHNNNNNKNKKPFSAFMRWSFRAFQGETAEPTQVKLPCCSHNTHSYTPTTSGTFLPAAEWLHSSRDHLHPQKVHWDSSPTPRSLPLPFLLLNLGFKNPSQFASYQLIYF